MLRCGTACDWPKHVCVFLATWQKKTLFVTRKNSGAPLPRRTGVRERPRTREDDEDDHTSRSPFPAALGMSASTASACDAEPTLRAFILGSLELEDAPSLDPASPFPDLGRDIDETDLDLSGICAWLDAPPEPGVAPDAPRCASPEGDDASFLRDFRGSLEEFLGAEPASDAEPRVAKRRRSFRESLAETTFGGTDTPVREPQRQDCFVSSEKTKSSDASSRDDGKTRDDEKSAHSARLRRNRASAAASRARKRDETAALRRTVRELEKANAHLSYAAQCAFAENAALRCRLGFQPQNIIGSVSPTTGPAGSAGPGFPGAAKIRGAEFSHEKTKATEPAALGRFIRPLPVMPIDVDVPSSSKASLIGSFAKKNDVRSRLRLGALRPARRRWRRRAGVATRDAVVDARVFFLKRRDHDRRGDDDAETLDVQRATDAVFRVARCEAARALSAAPRRATRKPATRKTLSTSRLCDVSNFRRCRVCRAETHFASDPEST